MAVTELSDIVDLMFEEDPLPEPKIDAPEEVPDRAVIAAGLTLPAIPGGISLQQAQERLRKALVEGPASCLCCGGTTGLYCRKLNSGMAASLIWLSRHFQGGWVDIPSNAPRYVLNSREIGKLVHWGLVETSPSNDPSKKTSGKWMPTPAGITFVQNQSKVPSHVYLYQNNIVAWAATQVTIVEALGDKFNYSQLMASCLGP